MLDQIEKMTLRQKLGQLFMFGFEGYTVPEHIEKLIGNLHLGGIIYFRRNVSTNEQIKQLSSQLQEIAGRYSSVPLSIAIDQEGGMVARIDQEVTIVPGQMTLGATDNSKFAYEAGKISAMELAQLGITVNFAPVLDVNNNPLNPVIGIRSFGENPNKVAAFGVEMIRGYQEMGIAACAKHFPGHGDTSTDSHEELPSVHHPLERIEQVELVPFKAAIANDVELIMTAHVQFPAIEPNGQPATLSYNVLTKLLRQKLKFEGVIVTDCLEMNAISEGVGIAKGTVDAFLAGADLILVSHRLDRQLIAYEALEQAVRDGLISEQRINESVERILRMKARQQQNLNHAQSSYLPIGDKRSLDHCNSIMELAVTLVQDKTQVLPLSKQAKTLVIYPEVRRSTQVDEVIEQELTLGKQLANLGGNVEELVVGAEPDSSEVKSVLDAITSNQFSQLVIGLYNATQFAGQTALIEQIKRMNTDTKLVFVSLRSPYDIALLNSNDTYICAYENRPAMLRAIALGLYGDISFQGQLPIQL